MLFLINIFHKFKVLEITPKYLFSGSKFPAAVNGDGQEFVAGILNDTTVSDISADITVDSVREHSM